MGSISVTFASTQNGVISASFTIPDEGMKRIYDVMKIIYEEQENKGKDEEDNNYTTQEFMERVVYEPKDICQRLALGFVYSLVESARDNERTIETRKISIPPIEVINN